MKNSVRHQFDMQRLLRCCCTLLSLEAKDNDETKKLFERNAEAACCDPERKKMMRCENSRELIKMQPLQKQVDKLYSIKKKLY